MDQREKAILLLVNDCIIAHQESIIVKLIAELERDYVELAKLATMGEYTEEWTHEQELNHITYET